VVDRPLVWRDRLVAELAGEDDRSLRLLRAAKVIQGALTEAGFTMVIVGGSAITAYDPAATHTGGDVRQLSAERSTPKVSRDLGERPP
jgi:hypothetical protein